MKCHQVQQAEKTNSTSATHHCNHLIFDDVDGIQIMENGFDGSLDTTMPYSYNTFMTAYRQDKDYQGNGDSDESDADVNDYRGGPSTISPTLTRQERKALDKEIPWQTIMKMDEATIGAYVEAARKEERSWMTFGSLEAVPREQAIAILRDSAAKKRVLRSRAAYRDKARGVPPLRPKCPIVAVGCGDPDLHVIQRESATPTRQAEHIIYTIFIAAKNGKLLGMKNAVWCLWSGDVSTAFLQGEPEQREKPLYLLPPQDWLTRRAGIFNASLYLRKHLWTSKCTSNLADARC